RPEGYSPSKAAGAGSFPEQMSPLSANQAAAIMSPHVYNALGSGQVLSGRVGASNIFAPPSAHLQTYGPYFEARPLSFQPSPVPSHPSPMPDKSRPETPDVLVGSASPLHFLTSASLQSHYDPTNFVPSMRNPSAADLHASSPAAVGSSPLPESLPLPMLTLTG